MQKTIWQNLDILWFWHENLVCGRTNLLYFSGEKLIPGDKYIMTEQNINDYSMQMNLTVLNLEKHDFGGYVCISSNALGKAEGVVRLQGKRVFKKC